VNANWLMMLWITTSNNGYGKFMPLQGKQGFKGMRDAHKEHLARYNKKYFEAVPGIDALEDEKEKAAEGAKGKA